jgi:AcrR family transcriptional regulator
MSVSDVSPERLPRGRHRIAADAVAASQRERLMWAVVRVVGERGWSGTRIADVVAAAAVSRRTFYELFPSLEACFIGAVETGFTQLMAAMDDRAEIVDLDVEARIRRFVTAYLELLDDTPGAMRALHLEMTRATDGVHALHDRLIAELGARLLVMRYGEEGARDVPADFGVALVGGFEHVLNRRIRASSDGIDIPGVTDDITAIVVRALA